ncbi:alpha-ketoglutarate-dependent dioxygenase AlkB [Flavobacteriales bacterium]|nr:alpha-ketoglutarate-dependent dioxygenase AlkB [Flavobacteriales bacterium]
MNLFNSGERVFENIPIPNGQLLFMPNFMSEEKAQHYYQILLKTVDWQQEKVTVFGKTHPVPRETAWYGEKGIKYVYSNVHHAAKQWTKELLEIKTVLDHYSPNQNYNSVLLNNYRHGNDKVGWHSDDEPELGKTPTIASISLGVTRRFDLKHKLTGEKRQIHLNPGSLLIMLGELQQYWKHQVPAQKKIEGGRINLTYRHVK